MRLYIVPVRDYCNSSCLYCYMKEKDVDKTKPQFVNINNLQKSFSSIEDKLTEVEITGGGEPLLHPNIKQILEISKDKYTKLYTNGFLLKDICVDEINISRVHPDPKINQIYNPSKMQNILENVLSHYRSRAKKIRLQTILLKGAIDSEEKALEFIKQYEHLVDVFMFRTLFPSSNFIRDKFVPYFPINHPKVKIDKTLDTYDKELFFIGTDSIVHDKFIY